MARANVFVLGVAAFATLAASFVNAQEIDGHSGPGFLAGYNDDDLILAFFSSSDQSQASGVNSTGDVLFNLGQAANFTGLAPGTYSVAGFDGSNVTGQGPTGWGSTELDRSLTALDGGTFWTVMGSNRTSDELWLTGETAQSKGSASTQSTLATIIENIGYAGANNSNADGSAYDFAQTTGNYLLTTEGWQNFLATAAIPVSSTDGILGLYQLSPGTGSSGSTTELGYFTLIDNDGAASLSFTVPSVQAPPPPSSTSHLVNISSRAYVGTGAELEIAGFVISGPSGSTEQVLVRGIGPALSQFDVTGVLAAPVLTLYDSSGNVLAANTGWTTASDAADIAAAGAGTRAFALQEGSADSAILITLPPGAYTAQIEGVDSATGIALAEVYAVNAGTAELINISTRAFVGSDSEVEIGGFVIGGTQAKTVLVRAVGPTLASFGVTDNLAQPSLTVVDSAGNSVASNNGWSNNADAATIASVAHSTGAFSLPEGSADCALLLTLAPGSYTAIVAGENGASGVALMEVYQAP